MSRCVGRSWNCCSTCKDRNGSPISSFHMTLASSAPSRIASSSSTEVELQKPAMPAPSSRRRNPRSERRWWRRRQDWTGSDHDPAKWDPVCGRDHGQTEAGHKMTDPEAARAEKLSRELDSAFRNRADLYRLFLDELTAE